jgi:16S rRNA (uracil1498-N3)-methyltransferase
MNRVLVRAEDVGADGRIRLADRRAAHIREVLRGVAGQRLRVGVIDGACGWGVIERADGDGVVLRWEGDGEIPPPARVDLLLALPRPKVMKRLWAPLASLGVGSVTLVNASQVERQYFDTHWLDPAFYTPLLVEGLEQSGDTRLPKVRVCRQFKPYVEDELGEPLDGERRWMADPAGEPAWRIFGTPGTGPVRLAVGPEGGWTAYEGDLLAARGFERMSLGWRTLRSDTATVAVVSLAQAWLEAGAAGVAVAANSCMTLRSASS